MSVSYILAFRCINFMIASAHSSDSHLFSRSSHSLLFTSCKMSFSADRQSCLERHSDYKKCTFKFKFKAHLHYARFLVRRGQNWYAYQIYPCSDLVNSFLQGVNVLQVARKIALYKSNTKTYNDRLYLWRKTCQVFHSFINIFLKISVRKYLCDQAISTSFCSGQFTTSQKDFVCLYISENAQL